MTWTQQKENDLRALESPNRKYPMSDAGYARLRQLKSEKLLHDVSMNLAAQTEALEQAKAEEKQTHAELNDLRLGKLLWIAAGACLLACLGLVAYKYGPSEVRGEMVFRWDMPGHFHPGLYRGKRVPIEEYKIYQFSTNTGIFIHSGEFPPPPSDYPAP